MPQVNSYPRTVQPVTTYSKMVSPAAEDKSKYRRSLAKRLITRIKHLQNELETEVFIEEQLRISPEEEQMMNEVVGKIDHLFAANNPGGFKVRNPLLGDDTREITDIRIVWENFERLQKLRVGELVTSCFGSVVVRE